MNIYKVNYRYFSKDLNRSVHDIEDHVAANSTSEAAYISVRFLRKNTWSIPNVVLVEEHVNVAEPAVIKHTGKIVA